MENKFAQVELERRPGRRSGCSCCSFTMMGLVSLPLLAVVLLFVVL
jgi:hypothetical protein